MSCACPDLAQHQIAVIPPSADQTAPVVYAVRSEARNAITSATSSGSPARRSGIVSSSASCSAGVTHSVIGVLRVPGNDAVDADSVGGVVGGEHAHEPVDAGLARRVRVVARRAAEEPRRRADENDRAAARVEQRADPVLRDQEHAGEIDVDRASPDVEDEPVGAVVLPRELDARAAEHGVEAVPRGDGRGDGGCDLSLVREIGDECERIAAGVRDLGNGARGGGRIDVEDADARALARADLRRLAPDPVAGAGDDRALSVQQAHPPLPSLFAASGCVLAAAGPDAWMSIRVRSVRSQAR